MLWKNRNQKVGLCVMVVTASLVLVGIWAALATPEAALASPGGGNVVKQDIPAILTLTGTDLTSDGGPYSDSENGTSCAVGRRRHIWVNLSKNSPRSMNLSLGTKLDSSIGDPMVGYDPEGVFVMTPIEVEDLGQPNASIEQVELEIACGQNVSGLGEEIIRGGSYPIIYAEDIGGTDIDEDDYAYNTMYTNTRLIFLDDAGKQWGIYFGHGTRSTDGSWGAGRYFTNLKDNNPQVPTDPEVFVKVQRLNPDEDPKQWKVDSQGIPGFLWYKGSNKNAPWVYVGKYNVPWSCDVQSLE